MPLIPRLFLLAAAALLPAMAAYAQPRPSDCAPGAPCSKPLSVRVVIVTMFEIGADTGDAPGEFQLWKERRKLDTRIPFPQGYHDLYYNPDSRILAMVTGVGTARSGTGVMALGLDPRFDLSNKNFREKKFSYTGGRVKQTSLKPRGKESNLTPTVRPL